MHNHLLTTLPLLPLSLAQITVLTLQPSPNNNNPPQTQTQTLLANALPMASNSLTTPTPSTTPTATDMETNPNSLPSLLSLLPLCALPCFAQAARTINCTPSDLSCLCRANTNNAAALRLNVATCLGGTSVFTGGEQDNSNPPPSSTNGSNEGGEEEEGCELDKLEELGSLAGRICTVVNDQSTTVGELEQGRVVIEEALARTSASSTTGSDETGTNGGVRVEISRAAKWLIGVAVFAFVVL